MCGEQGFQVIKVNQGATEKNFEIIKRFLSDGRLINEVIYYGKLPEVGEDFR